MFHSANINEKFFIRAGVLFLLLGLTLFNGFFRLSEENIRNWDEALYGISACEMMKNRSFLVNKFQGKPDYWNVKPVLAFFPQAAGMALLGKNNLGLRFASALALLLTGGAIFLFLRGKIGFPGAAAAWFALIVNPVNWAHCYRTGDADSIFILFVLCAFGFLWNSRKQGWLLVPAGLMMSFAFLTKSFHAGVPAFLALLFFLSNIRCYHWKMIVAGVAAALMPILIWGVLRYQYDGWRFFQEIVCRDLLGRVQDKALCEHRASPWYAYLGTLNHYLLVIPCGIVLAWAAATPLLKEKQWVPDAEKELLFWTAGSFLLGITFFSCCSIKLPWYIYPWVTLLAVLEGLVFQAAWLVFFSNGRKLLSRWTAAAVLLAFGIWFCIGEGKAIRVFLKHRVQRDVLLSWTGSRQYAHQHFAASSLDGKAFLPEPSILLAAAYTDATVIPMDLKEFLKDPAKEYLIVSCENMDQDDDVTLTRQAEKFAEKHSLVLIRASDCHALFQKKADAPSGRQ